MSTEILPWGRFRCTSIASPNNSDHIYFHYKNTYIGRSSKCHVILKPTYISHAHCIVTLERGTSFKTAVCTIMDLSRNGVSVNDEKVGKGQTMPIKSKDTIHFTVSGIINTDGLIYTFEIFNDNCWSRGNIALRDQIEAQSKFPTKEQFLLALTPLPAISQSVTKASRLTTTNIHGTSLGKRKRQKVINVDSPDNSSSEYRFSISHSEEGSDSNAPLDSEITILEQPKHTTIGNLKTSADDENIAATNKLKQEMSDRERALQLKLESMERSYQEAVEKLNAKDLAYAQLLSDNSKLNVEIANQKIIIEGYKNVNDDYKKQINELEVIKNKHLNLESSSKIKEKEQNRRIETVENEKKAIEKELEKLRNEFQRYQEIFPGAKKWKTGICDECVNHLKDLEKQYQKQYQNNWSMEQEYLILKHCNKMSSVKDTGDVNLFHYDSKFHDEAARINEKPYISYKDEHSQVSMDLTTPCNNYLDSSLEHQSTQSSFVLSAESQEHKSGNDEDFNDSVNDTQLPLSLSSPLSNINSPTRTTKPKNDSEESKTTSGSYSSETRRLKVQSSRDIEQRGEEHNNDGQNSMLVIQENVLTSENRESNASAKGSITASNENNQSDMQEVQGVQNDEVQVMDVLPEQMEEQVIETEQLEDNSSVQYTIETFNSRDNKPSQSDSPYQNSVISDILDEETQLE